MEEKIIFEKMEEKTMLHEVEVNKEAAEEMQVGNETEPIFYGTKEVAALFKCSLPTAREIMRRNDFPLLVIGGKWIVLKSALIKWASERRL